MVDEPGEDERVRVLDHPHRGGDRDPDRAALEDLPRARRTRSRAGSSAQISAMQSTVASVVPIACPMIAPLTPAPAGEDGDDRDQVEGGARGVDQRVGERRGPRTR